MASVNKVILIGNLGRDPETRYLPDGKAACNFSIATSETWKDKNSGEKKEATEWHRISTFGKLAEICSEYLKKGSTAYIEGSLRTRKWTDKSGVEKYTTEINADRMQMLGGKPSGERQERSESAKTGGGNSKFDDMPDDIPFATSSLGDDPMWSKLHWGSE